MIKLSFKTFACITLLSINLQINAQYCVLGGPSSTIDSNLKTAYLLGDSGTAINFTGCPGLVGVNDQTSSQSVDLTPGNTYTLDILFGTCGGSYAGVGEIWIDFDQSLTFEPSESIGTWSGTPPTTISSLSFTVPLSATNGQTRMRIIHQEGGSLPIDPCASFSWGSVTDFNVNHGPGIDCTGYVGDDMTDPRVVNTLPYQENYNNSICYSNNVTVYSSPDVFYRLIPANYGIDLFNVSLCGSNFDTYLQILDTDTNVVAYNDDYSPCAPQSEVSFSSIGHDTLYVVVQGWSNEKGDYSITINDGNVTGIDLTSTKIEIYPNPSSGKMKISGIVQDTEIIVTNTEGQLIYIERTNHDIELDLKVDAGLYFISIKSKNNTSIKKLIIEL